MVVVLDPQLSLFVIFEKKVGVHLPFQLDCGQSQPLQGTSPTKHAQVDPFLLYLLVHPLRLPWLFVTP